ncbi:MAG: PEGA domain-containing protein [Deltaproteobacteria bacterium]|nr:PEGA domain-containing protein [Deltaproteobacteria bacterium]
MKYGRYETLRELGKGSMGVVYQAHDPQIDRIVALKVLRQDRHSSEAFVRRFVKEAKAIGRLSHPNIVTVYDAGDDQGTIYIAMEFLEGRPLNELLQEKTFSYDEILDLGIQVAETLDYAHSKGVIHRDIKPSNIVVQPKGQVKITDFGIAHIEDPSATLQTQDGEILGTPAYMSPEQVLGHAIDGRSDLFSLGVILYELSTGKRPFGREGKTLVTLFNEIVHSEPAEPAQLNNEVDPRLSRVIMKCLSKDPENRYSSGEELASALRACKGYEETLLRPVAPAEKTPAESKEKKGNLPLLFLLLLLISVGSLPFLFPGFWGEAVNRLREVFRKEEIPVKVAVLKIRTAPSEAEVHVDGESAGKTPLDLRVPLGKKSITLMMPGYNEWHGEVLADQEIEYPLMVELRPLSDLARLKLQSTPPGAEVFVNGVGEGKTPLGLELPLGKHSVRMQLAGYEPWEEAVLLTEAREYPLSAEMKKIVRPGLATGKIDTNPAGASVYVNNELKGKTPLELSLPLGQYHVRMQLSGYLDWVDVVKWEEEKVYSLGVELKPALAMATLQVATSPPGGEVYVDGKLEGKAPVKVELPMGQRKVRVTLPGHEEWSTAVDIREPREYPLQATLKPLVRKAELQIDSNPQGARVYLDGESQGVTPLKLASPGGKHTIRLALADHQDWENTVQLEEGREYPFKIDLKPLSTDAFLSVLSNPPNASVYVNGVAKGKTPLRLRLSPGKYEVRMSLNKYRDWKKEVQLVAAQEYPLEAKLTPAPPRKPTEQPKKPRQSGEVPFRPPPPSGDDWVTGPYKDRKINGQ